MLHVAAIGSLFFIQGCGTTRMRPCRRRPSCRPRWWINRRFHRGLPPPPKPVVRLRRLAAPVETVEYVVKSGDALSKIAARHKVSVKQVMDLNKISDPNKIRIGQKLIIPAKPGVTLHEPAKPKAKPAAPAKTTAPAGRMNTLCRRAIPSAA